MKKKLFVIMLAVFIIACSTVSYAENHEGKEGKKGNLSMHGMMMEKMMPKNIAATADGSVIVLAGNKLLKYDADLNLVKEVEVKMDVEAMMKSMKECRANMAACKAKMEEWKKKEKSE
ncbi:hypothetical protein ACFL60_00230 [Candidatus Omnitrophota bacterium]